MIFPKYHIHIIGDFDFSIGFHRSPAVISTAETEVITSSLIAAALTQNGAISNGVHEMISFNKNQFFAQAYGSYIVVTSLLHCRLINYFVETSLWRGK